MGMSSVKNAVIIQARTDSSRLPGKVLADVAGRPLICFLVERIKRCKLVDEIILATTGLSTDDNLAKLGERLKIKVVRGDNKDVLSRYVQAARETSASTIVRITGDCPLVDPRLLEEGANYI